jgi:hypothetical protein
VQRQPGGKALNPAVGHGTHFGGGLAVESFTTKSAYCAITMLNRGEVPAAALTACSRSPAVGYGSTRSSRHPIDGAVERDDTADTGALGTGNEIGLGEVQAVDLVHSGRHQRSLEHPQVQAAIGTRPPDPVR